MPSQPIAPSSSRWIHATALTLLVVCSCRGLHEAPRPGSPASHPAGHGSEAHQNPMEAIARGLRSDDWEKRYDALQQLRVFGDTALDVILPVLQDRNEAVRKAAQNHFIRLGEAAVPYLVERLVNTEQDVGFYARIAGGKERHEIKSLAGTLWLALARGTARDRVFEIVQELISSDSARIRAVGLFTAAAMREARFLRLLEPIARDQDPMIRDRFRESLVLLLVKRSGSAPDLDEVASRETLTLLEPEMVPMLNSEKRGAIYTWHTYGSLLERARVHAKLRPRFIDMLNRALNDDRLTVMGAVHAGAIIAGQLEAYDLPREFRERVQRLELEKNDSRVYRQLAALSSFPSAAYDLQALARLLDFADEFARGSRVEARGLPMLAASFLLRAMAEADQGASRSAMAFLSRWIAHEDPRFSLEAAIAHARVLEVMAKRKKRPAEKQDLEAEQTAHEDQRRKLVASADRHADALFARAKSLSVQELFELEKLFVFLGDKRYLDLFGLVWSHRRDDRPGIHSITTRALLLLADRREKAILPLVLDCAERPEGKWHHKLRDGCVYGLTQSRRFGSMVGEFLTEERLERWVEIIRDPHLYPRTRAGFFPILEGKALGHEQRKVLADLVLKYTSSPHDSNQRSKAILSLGRSGDRRALAPLYAMAMETDHPWWIWENLVPTLAMLHGAPQSESGPEQPRGPVPRKAMEVLVDLLDAQLATMKPHDGIRFAYPNNYFSWGIEYLVYPPELTVYFLKKYTGKDFGMKTLEWRTWLSNQEDILRSRDTSR
jgi:hypothetical protein